jgi:hypothetical protein
LRGDRFEIESGRVLICVDRQCQASTTMAKCAAVDYFEFKYTLRTGILQVRIPLLASFLDVFCYQYSIVDKLSREAWRKVWEEWGGLAHGHRPPTPAFMDYLIFRLGKLACKRNKRICPPGNAIRVKKLESLIPQDRLVFGSDRYCIFSRVCKAERKMLNAPNSISIEGKTGWKSGKTNEGGGGGISS